MVLGPKFGLSPNTVFRNEFLFMNVIESGSREEILQLKLLCKSGEFTNGEIWDIFVNFELRDENEMFEIVDVLKQYSPINYKRLIASI